VSRFDLDRDGTVTDAELARAPVPRRWDRFGLRGPAIVLRFLTRNARRLAVLVAGGAVLAAGAAMLVLPGPGLIVIVLGLVILATEFAWAERALDRAQHRTKQALDAVHRHRRGRHALATSAVLMLGVGAGTTVAASDARMVGVSLLIGGACALATLHPRVRAWIGRRAHHPPGP
jgi:uncharacterized protein (TIGR02611 family)